IATEATSPAPQPESAVATPPPAPRVQAGVLLELADVAKAFEGVRALRRGTLDVREGEVLGLLGPNGSGKSTLINGVSGHYRHDGGRSAFRGHDIGGRPAHRIARAGIARTYQIPRPWHELTVRDNVRVAAMFGGGKLESAGAGRGDVRRRNADARGGRARGRALARIHRPRGQRGCSTRRAQPPSAKIPGA